jgi:hypothetical protein
MKEELTSITENGPQGRRVIAQRRCEPAMAIAQKTTQFAFGVGVRPIWVCKYSKKGHNRSDSFSIWAKFASKQGVGVVEYAEACPSEYKIDLEDGCPPIDIYK